MLKITGFKSRKQIRIRMVVQLATTVIKLIVVLQGMSRYLKGMRRRKGKRKAPSIALRPSSNDRIICI